jgi:hypothetical protein
MSMRDDLTGDPDGKLLSNWQPDKVPAKPVAAPVASNEDKKPRRLAVGFAAESAWQTHAN